MLHVCTPLYRPVNLPIVYDSIPRDPCIRWHVAYSGQVEEPRWRPPSGDSMVSMYRVDCLDSEIYKKRNHIFDLIDEGYFCLLDDDTVMHENMLKLYKMCASNKSHGMFIGRQKDWDGRTRLTARKPEFTKIDTGNVLCHHSCLASCRWPSSHIDGVNHKDFLFWQSVHKFYGERHTLINFTISIYNKLRPRRR